VIDDDRGQMDAGSVWWRVWPVALAVLVLVANEVFKLL
jgi:hypothetical protein